MRLRDFFLIAVVLAAGVVGLYELGHRVDSTSSNLAKQDSPPSQTQTVTKPSDDGSIMSRRKIELAAASIGGAAAIMVAFSLASSLSRPRRRKATWRATH
jgi:hypothetical protein